MRGGGIGCGTLLVLIVLSVIFKQDFLSLLGPALVTEETGVPASTTDGELVTTPEEEQLVDFMSFVLDDIQGTWRRSFRAPVPSYQDAQMVLFRDGDPRRPAAPRDPPPGLSIVRWMERCTSI